MYAGFFLHGFRHHGVDALVELSHLHAARGDYAQATTATRAALLLDPAREAAYRDLMHYAVRQGRRDEAIVAYRQCAEVLERELGVAPDPATRRLLDEARRPG